MIIFPKLKMEEIIEFSKVLKVYSNHNHTEISNFRLKDCIIRVEDLINRAIELGYHGVSCTDHEALSAHVKFLNRYNTLVTLKKKYNSLKQENKIEEINNDKDIQKELHLLEKMPEDFKIGLGNEIYLVDSLEEVKDNYKSGVTKFYHFILIAKDEIGYQQIKEISSKSAWKNWFKNGKFERVPTIKSELEEIIGDNKGHIIAQSACLGSELDILILNYLNSKNIEDKKKINKFIKWCIKVFGKENFFLEIQPCVLKYDDNGDIIPHPQALVNQFMFVLSEAYDLKVVWTNDAHYLKKDQRNVHESFLKSDDEGAKEREVGDFYETTYLMTKEEAIELFSTHLTKEQIIKAFKGTEEVGKMIASYDLSHTTIVPTDKKLPSFKLRHTLKDYYDKYEYIKKYAESVDTQDQYLLYMIENGLEEKNQWKDEVFHFEEYDLDGNKKEWEKEVKLEEKIARINEELSSFWQISERLNQKLSAYYVLVRGLIHEIMWKVSYVGVARGSVTGSYICYIISITQLNPLKYDLPFWRHSSPLRPELPDIDVDTEASKRQVIFQMMHDYYGDENVLNTLTFKTEGSKSAAAVCCKGLGINNDEAQYIADLIPFERGKNWSFKDCFEGNKDENRKPQTEFINEVAKYDGLKDVMLQVEGLISGRSIHASASYIFDRGYLAQNSRMRAPNGTFITAYNMADSDYQGGLKIDTLTIENLDKSHTAVDFLIENGIVEDKGSIKANYDAYLHPDILDYSSKEMWDLLDENKIIDAFQFDSPMGVLCIRKTKPRSLIELSVANSLVRLMAQDENSEAPMDTFAHYKKDISLWYKEMKQYNLSDREVKILEKYLKPIYGVADTQEVVMELTMDKEISDFDVVLANKTRKAIAKKKKSLIDEMHTKFFEHGRKIGTSENLLKYVWDVQIKRQLGYSFSKNHTTPYSCICLQGMNLVYKYSPLYWNCASLTVNSGGNDTENNKSTNYGKIAKAISTIQKSGQRVDLPDINRARFGFYPDPKNNAIVFGLKGIQGIGDDIAKAIIKYRPYTSALDFYEKMQQFKSEKEENKFGDSSMISLIKSGAFDELEHKDRKQIMKEFIKKISAPVSSLRMANIEDLNDLGLLTNSQKKKELRFFRFRKYIFEKKFFYERQGKSANTEFYILDKKFAEPFFFEYFENELEENKDYSYTYSGEICVKRGSIDKVFNKLMRDFKTNVLTNSDFIDKLNLYKTDLLWEEKDLNTPVSKWEMDSLSYYYGKHELENVDRDFYNIINFETSPSTAKIVEFYYYRGQQKPRFQLSRICGTVLDKNKNKNIIVLLTPDGVVTVKFYKGQFGFYDKQISEIDEETGKKTVIEKSWFSRGTKLLITGYRREDQFIPKQYTDSVYKHSVQLINGITEEGKLKLISERVGYEDELQ